MKSRLECSFWLWNHLLQQGLNSVLILSKEEAALDEKPIVSPCKRIYCSFMLSFPSDFGGDGVIFLYEAVSPANFT